MENTSERGAAGTYSREESGDGQEEEGGPFRAIMVVEWSGGVEWWSGGGGRIYLAT
jgi:hypothetical protein